ncbi:DNA-binding transcriptional regulator, PucR family [Nocardia amikacinitolerans]|uniref:PucR family transcriptional regulator n=1 Tax=Nocardia amikacinitolerans TaxID=756689 RepID=UPI000AD56AAE|nr:helix-turn-helix domain-containing protein [Nocardia amikacinitolerans]MCP2320163.1 DNA-binding transcriptional regulator, PucR family [Nocardia amikacinitolerans]
MRWPAPSARVADLIRQGAELIARAPDDWVQLMNEAEPATRALTQITTDPDLVAAMRRSNYDNVLAWATANIRAPGQPVPANASTPQLSVARDLVRRGVDQAALDFYRTGQNTAWQQWMQLCFGLTRDPDELAELLSITAASIATFVNDTVKAVTEHMDAERDELTRGSQADRREMVALILEGAPVPLTRAEGVLGYRLGGKHLAALVWTADRDADLGYLEQAAETLMRACGALQRLTVVASATTLWVWLPVDTLPDHQKLAAALHTFPEIRVAVGTPARGVEGFRRTHRDALEVRRFVARIGAPAPLATFEEIQLASLVTQDQTRAEEYVGRVLGDLAHASSELRETVRTYLQHLGNASAAAAALFTHRNTIVRRLARADELLPRPLETDPLRIAVALEVLRWQATTD